MIGVSNHLRNASIWVPLPFSEGDRIPTPYSKLVIRHVITTVDGSGLQRSPPDMHEKPGNNAIFTVSTGPGARFLPSTVAMGEITRGQDGVISKVKEVVRVC